MAYPNQSNNRQSARSDLFAEKQYDERVIRVNRVARVVKGGRRFRFQALVVLGDHNGQAGVGVSKGMDVAAAIGKATDVAKKSMVKVHLYNNTIPHEVQAKVGGANVLIMPASPGTGVIAGGSVRAILEVVGVENALSKSLGSSNRLNTAYATLKALGMLKPASEWVTNAKKSSSQSTADSPQLTVKKVASDHKPSTKNSNPRPEVD